MVFIGKVGSSVWHIVVPSKPSPLSSLSGITSGLIEVIRQKTAMASWSLLVNFCIAMYDGGRIERE